MPDPIVFSKAYISGDELAYVAQAFSSSAVAGDGPFTARATELVTKLTGGLGSLLTTSCTHALEMTALLLDLAPGDEVIMPSFTFVSTANAYALRGAVPVFVDVRPDTLNLDETQVEAAITDRTKAIVVVHYAGVAVAMDEILAIAAKYGVAVVEDNAHGLGGSYKGRPLGSLGLMATQSFHGTKNVHCGEGGALVVNDTDLLHRAEIIREKGTNRSQFFRGQVDKYRWVDIGSSYLPADPLAAFLTGQLERFDQIQAPRLAIWERYDRELADWAGARGIGVPTVPEECVHPAHMYYLLMPSHEHQLGLIAHLRERNITAPFHYIPLHSAPAGEKYGRVGPGGCDVTERISGQLVRLPLFSQLTEEEQTRVIEGLLSYPI
ncbi:TDP-4-keto-6-deoxy-D-glucose transaminase [Kribbella flavida DSM 17836]|uniref:TDP-4-keto-6-deoxy-D-glucose transaminase n=1 Tax=Kribbella flavida (strain DSM 17836 / JCM 10339 / NBRC 14399) TaxID=479435 RepID=D2PVW9_KRIFD|nr:dTDP-4-amino-4,6-dideoxygalactose transaminase [Kribbella flavida]ADB29626.1 TDP-4-keto-6-deoxy-D-glucose transaminase [Kribbella flavida DSM 17836]